MEVRARVLRFFGAGSNGGWVGLAVDGLAYRLQGRSLHRAHVFRGMRGDAGVLTKASVSVGACEGSVLTVSGDRCRQ